MTEPEFKVGDIVEIVSSSMIGQVTDVFTTLCKVKFELSDIPIFIEHSKLHVLPRSLNPGELLRVLEVDVKDL